MMIKFKFDTYVFDKNADYIFIRQGTECLALDSISLNRNPNDSFKTNESILIILVNGTVAWTCFEGDFIVRKY